MEESPEKIISVGREHSRFLHSPRQPEPRDSFLAKVGRTGSVESKWTVCGEVFATTPLPRKRRKMLPSCYRRVTVHDFYDKVSCLVVRFKGLSVVVMVILSCGLEFLERDT